MKIATLNSMETKSTLPAVGKAALMLAFATVFGATSLFAQNSAATETGSASGQSVNERNPGTSGPVRNVGQFNLCPSIGSVQMVDMGFDKVLVTWNNSANFDSIVFRTTNLHNGAMRDVYIPGNPNPGRFFIQGLLPHTTYNIEVSTYCGGVQSVWTTPITVTTLAPRTSSPQIALATRILISPNPATTWANIMFTCDPNMIQDVVITNSTGQVVFQKTMVPNIEKVQLSVNVDPFPIGMYIVKVTNNRGIATERMIVQ